MLIETTSLKYSTTNKSVQMLYLEDEWGYVNLRSHKC